MSDTCTISEGKTKNGIFYRTTHTSSSRNVLALVMGYGGSLRIWPTSFVEKLAQHFQVITYDNRGTGFSIIPEITGEYTIKAMSGDLHEVMEHLGINSHHLLGYSMGSCIALQYCHDYAQAVQSVFLMCATAGGALYAKPDKELSMALAKPQGKTLWDIYMFTWQLMYSPQWFERCKPAFAAIYENSKHCPTRPQALAGHSHAFRNFDGTAFLQEHIVPTTILAGQNDRLMPVQNSINLAQSISGSHLILIEDCEHAPHIQNEERVIDEILAASAQPREHTLTGR